MRQGPLVHKLTLNVILCGLFSRSAQYYTVRQRALLNSVISTADAVTLITGGRTPAKMSTRNII